SPEALAVDGQKWLWLQAGLAVLSPAGGLGTAPYGALGVQLEGSGGWGLGALAFLPLSSNELHAREGEAEVGVHVLLLRASYSGALGSRWQWGLAAGPGLALLSLAAEARAPWLGTSDRLFCGVGTLELSLARELGGWLRLRSGLLAGLSAPRPVL